MLMLDTHTLIWWVNGSSQLSADCKQSLGTTLGVPNSVLVSSISVWEIALLVRKGRLRLGASLDDWLGRLDRMPVLRFVPVDNLIARLSVELPGDFHPDPADRMIVATAMAHDVCLLTSDARILQYPHVKTLW
jgi:PIN domain nuclease of toxin-antitoxin system